MFLATTVTNDTLHLSVGRAIFLFMQPVMQRTMGYWIFQKPAYRP